MPERKPIQTKNASRAVAVKTAPVVRASAFADGRKDANREMQLQSIAKSSSGINAARRIQPSRSPSDNQPVQRVVKADNVASLIKEQFELQEAYLAGDLEKPEAKLKQPQVSREEKFDKEVDKSPKSTKKGKGSLRSSMELTPNIKPDETDRPPRYTTVGFEHEFAQMQDGPLRGVSHLELARSDIELPVKELPFLLETDAGNSLELVSPPFLLETLPDAPIPLPEDVQKVDNMLELELRRQTRANGQTLSGFMNDFGLAAGLKFIWLTNKKGKVEVARKNFSHNTGKKIKKKNNLLEPKELEKIPIGPSNKGAHSIGNSGLSADLLQELDPASNTGGAVISQVNFATTATVFEEMRRIASRHPKIPMTQSLQSMVQVFRAALFSAAFTDAPDERKRLILEIEDLQSDLALNIPTSSKYGFSNPKAVFKDSISSIVLELKNPALDQEDFVRLSQELTKTISKIPNLSDQNRLLGSGEIDTNKESKEPISELQLRINGLKDGISQLPEVGTQSPNLRIFLNALARTLAGLVAIPAQDTLKSAQEKRMKGKKDAMTAENIGFEANLTSHVKDIDQSWLKDNIINFGMGLLSPAEWKQVLDLIHPGGTFQSNLDTMIKTINHRDWGSERFTNYLKALEGEVRFALKVLWVQISERRLDTDRPDLRSAGPEKAPDFMDSTDGVVGARQDTFIHPSRVQLPGMWPEGQLHVVESRWQSVEHIGKLATAWREKQQRK